MKEVMTNLFYLAAVVTLFGLAFIGFCTILFWGCRIYFG